MATPRETLQEAFIEALNVPADTDFDNLVYQSHGWDSVAHMTLIAAIEQRFDVMLSTDDVIDMSSFRKAQEILARNGVTV